MPDNELLAAQAPGQCVIRRFSTFGRNWLWCNGILIFAEIGFTKNNVPLPFKINGVKKKLKNDTDDDEELLESLDVETPELEIPVHPYLIVFDLKKHLRLKIHVSYIADYKYDKAIIDRLILPEEFYYLQTLKSTQAWKKILFWHRL